MEISKKWISRIYCQCHSHSNTTKHFTANWILHISHWKLNTEYCTMHTAHWILNTAQGTLHTCTAILNALCKMHWYVESTFHCNFFFTAHSLCFIPNSLEIRFLQKLQMYWMHPVRMHPQCNLFREHFVRVASAPQYVTNILRCAALHSLSKSMPQDSEIDFFIIFLQRDHFHECLHFHHFPLGCLGWHGAVTKYLVGQ